MRRNFSLLLFILLMIVFQGCNTLYNYRFINIEIVEPGKFLLPEKYEKATVIYNNANVKLNQEFAKSYNDTSIIIDKTNIDSIASKIYFNSFFDNLKNQFYFNSIEKLNPVDYSHVAFSDSLIQPMIELDSTGYFDLTKINEGSALLSMILKTYQNNPELKTNKKYVDPIYGLYSKEKLKEIAYSTKADLLISLDYFSSVDAITHLKINNEYFVGNMNVYSLGFWNFYNLKKLEPVFYFNHFDTIGWGATVENLTELYGILPPIKDAVLNAAEMSGERLVNLLIPHWTQVERLYYYSGQLDLQPTEVLIQEGKWQEASEIWKKQIDNPNKKIAAKCMFNLGIASEMEGDFDAAILWVVKSYKVFENQNAIHAENCLNYIRILSQRKVDVKKIERQINPDLIIQ